MFQKDYFQGLIQDLQTYPQRPRLVAVSKYVALTDIEVAYQAGQRDFGESRLQDLLTKAQHFSSLIDPIRWHFIGHLQRNKVSKVLPLISSIHSIDSLDLINNITNHLDQHPPAQPLQAYLQINLSGADQKYGLSPDDAGGIQTCLTAITVCPHLALAGLMGMSSAGADAASIRCEFQLLHQIRDQHQANTGNALGLSMGMSSDFKIALEEGSTLIRVGSHLFFND